MKKRIYYYHTDSGGVVYYAKYLEFLEEARTEFLEEKGISVRELVSQGTLFVVARQEIDYKMPAVYGDVLEVLTRISETSSVRINFENEIKNQDGQLIAKAKTVLVCVDKNLKPKVIPEDIKKRF
jgi:acyl-CoA thioester hydrolase